MFFSSHSMLPHLTVQQAAMHDKNGHIPSALSRLYLLLKLYTVYFIFIYYKEKEKKKLQKLYYCYMSAKVEVERKSCPCNVLNPLIFQIP